MSNPIPTELNLHKESKVLEVTFDDGKNFKLTCEYLRVNSPSAEVQGHTEDQHVLQYGKENVNIDRIEPIGNYAVCLHFDDEHNTGIYSWETLYRLGSNYEENWAKYLEKLEAAGRSRSQPS